MISAKRGKVTEKADDVYRTDSVFCDLVSKSGLTLKTGKGPNTLSKSSSSLIILVSQGKKVVY